MRSLGDFFTDTKGGVAIIFGVLLPCLLGISALAIEVGAWYTDKSRLQIASDAAAYSALVAYQRNKSLSEAIALGIAEARASGFNGPDTAITILIPAPEGTLGANSSRVILNEPTPLFLTQLFMNKSWLDISAVSYATMDNIKPPAPCMLALKPNQSRSIVVAASVEVNLGCVVASNSNASDAIWAEGTAKMIADCATVPGIIASNGAGKVEFTKCAKNAYVRETTQDHLSATPYWGTQLVPDTGYYADKHIEQGTYGADKPAGNKLQPGKYGKIVEIDGSVSLAPGIYYFSAGFRATPGSQITGEGVTIYIDQSTVLDIAQDVRWRLSAPTTGPTAGIAIMGNPKLPPQTVRLIGIMGNVQGAVYFPNDIMQTEAGPNLTTPRCTQIVAALIDIRGSGKINNDCSKAGNETGTATPVRLAKGPSV